MSSPAGESPSSGPRPATGAIAVAFVVSALASVAFVAVYATDGDTGLLGFAMAVALGSLGVGLVLWSKRLMPQGPWSEERGDVSPSAADEARTAATFAAGRRAVGRRRLLGRLLVGAVGTLGLATLVPLRSLGPRPQEVGETGWRAGARLVDAEGRPIRVDHLSVGGIVTAFPEGGTDRAENQVVVVRLDDAVLQAAPDRLDWAAGGNVAYSRVCTHAGCPVGMFQPDAHLLTCPCHQAAFDIAAGGATVFGPAPRPLPQLPLEVGEDDVLVASRDFTEPIGPDRWRMS